MKRIGIIGSGFSSISAATYLAKNGYDVTIFEKNDEFGGRARKFKTDNGFTFDMGPSWYWMPNVIDSYFNDFGKKTSDYFELVPLNPQFEMVFANNILVAPENFSDWYNTFENIESGSSEKLSNFMESAKVKYEVGMKDFVNKPCHSWTEFIDTKIIKSALKLNLTTNFRSYVKSHFKNAQLQKLMEFPVIFLGASPKKIPALYSMMNYGGYQLGTWYPLGGFSKLVDAMVSIAKETGVTFLNNHNLNGFVIENKQVKSLVLNDKKFDFDAVISGADYAFTESLLPDNLKNYTQDYWQNKTFAPSCLIYYLGINQKIDHLNHHTLFFEEDFDTHVDEIYENKKWPNNPLFYVCCPSKTDDSVAPKNCENLFLLLPIAIDLKDNESIRESYLKLMLERIEKKLG